jgi:hypothetical protein
MTTYVYKSLDDLISYAESLGWVDTYPDGSEDDYNGYVADAIEEECINFIESKDHDILHLVEPLR